MIENLKHVDALQVADLQAHPVWQYANREGGDETLVRPVRRGLVSNLAGKLVGTQVTFSCGQRTWALIGNVHPNNMRLTEHFITLSIERDGKWFTLSRYHDFDYAENGPEALSHFLDLPVDELFPIAYDINDCFKGGGAALSGCILREPRERLSRAEIIAMAVP
jgi:hypothetical protein